MLSAYSSKQINSSRGLKGIPLYVSLARNKLFCGDWVDVGYVSLGRLFGGDGQSGLIASSSRSISALKSS